MPIVNPAQDAAYYPQTVIYSAPATVEVNRTPGAAQYSTRASASVRGELQRNALATLATQGQPTRYAPASLQSGIFQPAATMGAIGAGLPSKGSEPGAMDVQGFASSMHTRAALDAANPGGNLSPIPQRAALSSVSIQRDASGGAATRASVRVQGESRGVSRAGASVKLDSKYTAPATLETYISKVRNALASLEAGTHRDGQALASAEIQDAQGVEFLIDVLDATLAAGRGDLC